MAGFYNKMYDRKTEGSKLKGVYFNPNYEADLLEFAENIKFSRWVKDKIREELDKKKENK